MPASSRADITSSLSLMDTGTVQQKTVAQLRDEYKQATGKNWFGGWTEEQLELRIANAKGQTQAVPEVAQEEKVEVLTSVKESVEVGKYYMPIEEAAAIIQRYERDKPSDPIMVFIGDTSYAIIDGKYVPWNEASIMAQEIKVKYEIARLSYVRAGRELPF